ncbi:MAG TPA: ATP-binding protein [Pyrinomonadaceae bacterium]|jgi:two-component system sensor histidine kinase KdpD
MLAAAVIVALTAGLKLLGGRVNSTTVALALLLAVLFIAARMESGPALVASVLAMLCFNFFFLPPFGTLHISEPENWVALSAFLLTAVVAGQLSTRARRRAEEAEAGRLEIGRLYEELRAAFERASHAEALRQSERLKSALLDAVTHDIRTPLTSIKASVTTLLDGLRGRADGGRTAALDAESRREMLEVIDEESDRLNRFVEGLIELARIEAGELRLRLRWGAVDEVVAAALSRAEPLTRNHPVSVEVEDELPAVRVDPRAVAEVVYTLVDNAAKYSPPGTTIRVAASRAEGDRVRVAVEDEGRGIPPDLRERVFDKFFRATRDGDAGGHSPAGTGMGLAIARGIVEAHGGRIRVEGRAGRTGARVVFTLPIGDEEAGGEVDGDL